MDSKLLIDNIVRQTTVLIAQLSTSAGLRSPLARIADQVFVELAREIEAQGVSRKVAADMFGLALRSYQRKVARIREDTTPGATLWQSVVDGLEKDGPLTRQELLRRFSHKEEVVVLSVLTDLVAEGFVYRSGRGEGAVHGLVPDADLQKVILHAEASALEGFMWHAVFKGGRTLEATLFERFGDLPTVRAALSALLADGRVRREETEAGAWLEAGPFVLPVGAPKGWETAVFDHFQAVTSAIIGKLRNVGPRSAATDLVGGTTMHFGIHDAHPCRDEVLGCLKRSRESMDALLERVTDYNRAHPVPEEQRTKVTFYFGQNVTEPAFDPKENGESTTDEGPP